MRKANKIIKKIHIYVGLLNLTILFVFGLTGVIFMVKMAGGPPPKLVPTVRYESLTVPATLKTDGEIAAYVRRELGVPMLYMNTRRDADNNLQIAYGTHTGGQRVTILKDQNRARAEVTRRGVVAFIDMIHATAQTDAADWRVRLWGYYVEFSIWSLLAMTVSGVYLWLSSRPRYLWAQVALWSSCGIFVVLWIVTR